MAMLIAPSKEAIFRVTEVLFQQILVLFFLLIIWELFKSNAYPASSKDTWHIILNVLGVALCMAEGVQIYRKQSIVTIGDTRDEKRIAHLVVMLFSFVCITTGISLKISTKTEHFKSIHSQLGLSSWVISFVALIGGITAYYSRSMPRVSPMIVKVLHIFIGITAYIIGVATLVYGLEYLMGAHSRGWVALTVLLLVYVAYSLLEPCKSLFNLIMGR
ncbi:unnamed protein product [Phyllotreta striolata]|uniref:ascorbate ferrireductase (transmembrane) n=1 Tax=Phyllotreta striolata TaxID=444603 RepID=A0A9N9XQE4_PHYSR|nr:unnamed protein product [Phyllotreta striolata]